jgi:hypothetical protein
MERIASIHITTSPLVTKHVHSSTHVLHYDDTLLITQHWLCVIKDINYVTHIPEKNSLFQM